MPLQSNSRVRMPIERGMRRSINFPNTPYFPLPLINARLVQKPNSHDILFLSFAGKINDATIRLVAGDPVIFSYSVGSLSNNWVGYVSSIRPVTSGDNYTEVYCISPSYLMKNTSQKIYKNITADAVVKKICAKYGFKAVTQRHPRVFSALAQAGQSDWQMLRMLAKKTGFLLKVDGTTIYFMSKDKISGASKKSAQYFYAETRENTNRGISNLGTLMKFNPYISDESPDNLGNTADRIVNGIHQTTGSPISTNHEINTSNKNNNGAVIPNAEFFE